MLSLSLLRRKNQDNLLAVGGVVGVISRLPLGMQGQAGRAGRAGLGYEKINLNLEGEGREGETSNELTDLTYYDII